jgi:hypothetical protein
VIDRKAGVWRDHVGKLLHAFAEVVAVHHKQFSEHCFQHKALRSKSEQAEQIVIRGGEGQYRFWFAMLFFRCS